MGSGPPGGFLRDLASYWCDAFDWRASSRGSTRFPTSWRRSAGTRSTTCILRGGERPPADRADSRMARLVSRNSRSRVTARAGSATSSCRRCRVRILDGCAGGKCRSRARRSLASPSSGPSSCPALDPASSRREATGAPPSRRGSLSIPRTRRGDPPELHPRLVRSVSRARARGPSRRTRRLLSRTAIAGSKRKARTAICRPRGRARRPMPSTIRRSGFSPGSSRSSAAGATAAAMSRAGFRKTSCSPTSRCTG